MRASLWPVARFLTRVRVTGADQVPRQGGVLLLCNHRSDIDVVYLQLSCRRHITYMAKEELFAMGRLGKFLAWWQAFPVVRDSADRGAIQYAVECLKAGRVVGVFPEGELSESGEMLPLKPGVALIARMAGTPVVCAGLRGTELVLPYAQTKPRRSFGLLTVNFGKPWQPEPRISAEAFIEEVRRQLLALSAPLD